MTALEIDQNRDLMPVVDDLYDGCVQLLAREGYNSLDLIVLIAGLNGDIARHAWQHEAEAGVDPALGGSIRAIISLIQNRPDNVWENLEVLAQTASDNTQSLLFAEDVIDHRDNEGRGSPITGLGSEQADYELNRWLLPRLNVFRAQVKRIWDAYELDRDQLIDAAGLALLRALVTLPERHRLDGILTAAEGIVAVIMAPEAAQAATEQTPAPQPTAPAPKQARSVVDAAPLKRTSGTDLRKAMFGAKPVADAAADLDVDVEAEPLAEVEPAGEPATVAPDAAGTDLATPPAQSAQRAMSALQRLKGLGRRKSINTSVEAAPAADAHETPAPSDPSAVEERVDADADLAEPALAFTEATESLEALEAREAAADEDFIAAEAASSDGADEAGLQEDDDDADADPDFAEMAYDEDVEDHLPLDEEPALDDDDTDALVTDTAADPAAPEPRTSALLANARIRAFQPAWLSR